MKKAFLIILCLHFFGNAWSQGRTLLYTSGGWVQLDTPSGQTPDNSPPTSIDDVVFSKSRSGVSTMDFGANLGDTFKIGGDKSSYCRRMYIIGMEVYFDYSTTQDYGARVDIYSSNGGFLSLDSGAILQHGQVHVFGKSPGLGDLQVRDSKFGGYEQHNTDWADVFLEDSGKARFINSSFTGFNFETIQKSTGVYATGTGIYAERSTFATIGFILGDNSVDTFLNSSIGQANNIIGLNFLIGKNSSFISDSDTIKLGIPCGFDFKTSGSVFRGDIEGWYINFGQEDPANPLPNIIDGNVLMSEEPGSGISGDVKISGNLTNQMPYTGFSDNAKVLVNNKEVFEIGGIRNFGNSTSISDCAENYCHYKMEFFGSNNSNIDWNIGFPVDTLVINKTGCAKVTSKNPLYVAGDTRIESGQLALDPIDSIPYKLVCAGKVTISQGGGIFLRKDAKGNVANIAIGDTLINNNTGSPDSTCAGLSNPYNGTIIFYKDTTSTGNTDTTTIGNTDTTTTGNTDTTTTGNPDTVQIAHKDSLINFSGSYFNKSITLSWTMQNQTNTKNFTIEKSFDASAFSPLNDVSAAPNSQNQNDYNYVDVSSLNLLNYYRLKIFDINERYYYSDTITVAGPNERVILLYPNPVKDKLFLRLSNIQGEAEINIVDLKGAVLMKLKTSEGSGDIPINTSNLPPGAYSLIIHASQLKKTLPFIKE